MFEGFETSPTRGRKPIGIDTATTQAEPTENGTLKQITVGSFFYPIDFIQFTIRGQL